MKLFFAFVLLLFAVTASAQIVFPGGFRQIKGERGSGLDDVYTNGRYSFLFHRDSFFYEENGEDPHQYKGNDERFRKYVGALYGFPFLTTRDSLLVGTGRIDDHYSYIVVDRGGEGVELTSYYNDAGFSQYSRWLLSLAREYHKKGKLFMFPMH